MPPAFDITLNAGLSGAPNVVASLSSWAGRGGGVPNIEEITKFFDGLNESAWAILGYAIGGGSSAYTKVYSVAGKRAAEAGRAVTYPIAEDIAMKGISIGNIRIGGIHKPIFQQWDTYLERAKYSKIEAKTFTEMFDFWELRKMGIPQEEIDRRDDEAMRYNASLANNLSQPFANVNLTQLGYPSDMKIYKKPDQLLYADINRNSPGEPAYRTLSDSIRGGPPPGMINYAQRQVYSEYSDSRGGVSMHADVYQNKKADFSEMLGTEKDPTATPEFLYAPFLIFASNNRL